MSAQHRLIRLGLFALPLYAGLTLFATWTHQPDPSADFQKYAEYVSTDQFLLGHLLGSIGGTALAILGAAALFALLGGGRGGGWALAGFALSVVGDALILTLFGVAAFASPAVGRAYLDGQTGAQAINEAIYGAPLAITGVLGVLLYGAGAISFAVALWRSGRVPRWTAVAYAASGPLIGLLGLIVGESQTVGAALLLASTLVIATTASRRPATAGGARRAAERLRGVRVQ